MTKQIECFETALGVHIRIYNLTSREDEHVSAIIDRALQDGAHVILGGFLATTVARKETAVCPIVTGNQAYYEAFLNAKIAVSLN